MRRYVTAALFAAGCVAGWWAARRGVAGTVELLEGLGRIDIPDNELLDQDDDEEEVAVMGDDDDNDEVGARWAAAARPDDHVFTGVCEGCSLVFALRPWSVDVVELDGLFTVVGYCECGRIAATKHVDSNSAVNLIARGACPVNVLHPAEADEVLRIGRRPCWPDYAAGVAAARIAEAELDGDLAALFKEHGQ